MTFLKVLLTLCITVIASLCLAHMLRNVAVISLIPKRAVAVIIWVALILLGISVLKLTGLL